MPEWLRSTNPIRQERGRDGLLAPKTRARTRLDDLEPKPLNLMPPVTTRYVSGLAGLLLIVLLTGCGASHSSDSGGEATQATASDAAKPMVRVVVILDQSGSAPKNRILQMRPEQFQPLFDALEKQGGELAVGTIQSDSNRPLHRLQVNPPPQPPPSLPEDLNPYEKAQRSTDIERRKTKHQEKVQARQQTIQQNVCAFRDELDPVLNRKADARHSDIRRAVVRAELFLREPTVSDRPVQRFAILVTDGQDNVTEKLPAVKSGATYLVVNGSGVLGILQELDPKTFESPRAAFDFVARQISTADSQS